MQMLVSSLKLVLPIFALLFIGWLCRKKSLITPEGIAGLKNLVSACILPFVLFSALSALEFTPTVLILAVISFVFCLTTLGFGFATKKLAGMEGHPFLLSGYEIGMLGMALLPLLFGPASAAYLASLDLGACLFFFLVFVPAMQKGGKKQSVAQKFKSIFLRPTMIGCLLGLLFSATGLGKLFYATEAGQVFDSVSRLITSPITALILILVGYGLSFKKKIMGAVIKTSLLRLAVNALLAVAGLLLLNLLSITDPVAKYALLFMCALSAPYPVTIYYLDESQHDYMNTQLSAYTFVTFIVFILMSLI